MDARDAHARTASGRSRAASIDAINNWAERRERVVYYAATTLIEFGSQAERDQALELWPPGDEAAPIAVAERFLLVEDDRTVPYRAFA